MAGIKVFSKNKKAFFDYEILETHEAGISLLGQEVKSIKNGEVSLKEAYIRLIEGELWLWNAHIPKYRHSSDDDYDSVRSRRLLLKKKEIAKLAKSLNTAGLTLIPLRIYAKRGILKLEIALAKGKKQHDKQRRIKERELGRELHREQRKYMVK